MISAVVVDSGVAQQCRRAGLGIDIDLGDMAATREGEDVGHGSSRARPGPCHAVRKVGRILRASGQRRQGDRAVTSPHRETPSAKTSRLPTLARDMGREWCAAFKRGIDCLHDGGAAHVHGARAAMSCATLHWGCRPGRNGRALIARRAFSRDLGEGGLVAWPLGLRADRTMTRPSLSKPHPRLRWARRARFSRKHGPPMPAASLVPWPPRAPPGEALASARATAAGIRLATKPPTRSPCRGAVLCGNDAISSAGAARRDRGRACAPPPRWRRSMM